MCCRHVNGRGACRREVGLIDDEQWQRFEGKRRRIAEEKIRLGRTRVQPDSDVAQAFAAVSEQRVKAVCSPL